MADCAYFEELIAREPDGELTAEETAALHAHVAECESCRQFYKAMTLVTEELRGQAEPPAELYQNIMDEIGRISPEKRKNARILPFRALSLAAVAAIAILAGVRLIPGGAKSAASVSRMAAAGAMESFEAPAAVNGLTAPAAEAGEAFPEEESVMFGSSAALADTDKSAAVTAGGPAVTAREQYLRNEVFLGTEQRGLPAGECEEDIILSDGEEYLLWFDGECLLWQRAGEEAVFVSPVQSTEYRRKMAEIG